MTTLGKIVIQRFAQGYQKGTRRILCPEYTLNPNKKKNKRYISQIHVPLELAQTSTLSKVYIIILTKRLTFFVDANGRICESQSGFRSCQSTVDNAFILYSVINKYLSVRILFIYVAFIDFQKAFDSADRQLLYNILRQNGVKGKLFSAEKSIYVCVKTRVRTTCGMSDTFNCPIGLRQGCSLSPFIVALLINELYDVLHISNTRGVQLFPDIVELLCLCLLTIMKMYVIFNQHFNLS